MARQSRESGQSVVELALLLPLLLLLLSGLLDLGRAYYVRVTLEDMASEGALYAAIHPMDAAGVWERASQASGGMITVSPNDVDIDYPPVLYVGAPITVTVSYDFQLITPLIGDMFPGGVLRLRGTATHAIISLQ